jgi:long-chain acyl-CoA synthetase
MYLSMQTERPPRRHPPAGVGGVRGQFLRNPLAGKAAVPINFLLGDREIAHIIKDSDIDTVVTIPQLAGRLKDTPLNVIDLTQLPKVPPAAITPRFPRGFGRRRGRAALHQRHERPAEGRAAHIRQPPERRRPGHSTVHLQSQHVFLGVIPLFHSFGILAMMIAPIQLGATWIIYLARFSPSGTSRRSASTRRR